MVATIVLVGIVTLLLNPSIKIVREEEQSVVAQD